MNKSDSIAKIADALAKFQADVQDPAKNSNNPFFKSKYVELDDLLASVRPVLSKHGLAVLQEPSGEEKVSIKTIILHNSGEFIEFEPVTLRPVKSDPQGIGSAITYGRRYALSSILGVAWDADDDGNKASGKDNKEESKQVDNVTSFSEAQKQIQHDRQAERASSNIKWESFWASVKVFGLDEAKVDEIAADHFQKQFNSLTEIITTQQELNKFLSVLAKHKKSA